MKTKKIIVNLITTLRLILAIPLPFLFFEISHKFFFISVFLLFLSDFLDGFLARFWHVETFYGSLMDTIADKILNIVLIIPLIKYTPEIAIILLLEASIVLININGKIKGKKIKTKYIGKIKMWFVALTIILGYLNLFWNLNDYFVIISIGITCIIQVLTMIQYIIYFKKQKTITKYFNFKNKQEFIKALFDTEYYLRHN